MTSIPTSRVVSVTVARNDNFPSQKGFGTILFLTRTSKSGIVDASNRTKLYASFDEVSDDWASTDDFYKQALSVFSRNPSPLQIKAGYYDATGLDAAALQSEMDTIQDSDNNWYFLVVDAALRDDAAVGGSSGLMGWIQANKKLLILDSNDDETMDPADTTSVAAANKGVFDKTGVMFHPASLAAEYPGASLAAYMATRNFDLSGSAYTAKFKDMPGISPAPITSAQLTAITGYTAGIDQKTSVGHVANAYTTLAGRNILFEGSTLDPNVFLDEVHATDWIIARTEEAVLGRLFNNARVPYTQEGMEIIASAIREVMNSARRAGLIAADENPTTGEFEDAVQIDVPDVLAVPEAQRKNRVSPNFQVRFRYAGALHYVTVNYSMTF